jgi:hypothetical protein
MEGPNKPEPKPVSLDRQSTAVVVLDMSTRCHDPKDICSKLLQPLGEFLEPSPKFRHLTIFTVSASVVGSSTNIAVLYTCSTANSMKAYRREVGKMELFIRVVR